MFRIQLPTNNMMCLLIAGEYYAIEKRLQVNTSCAWQYNRWIFWPPVVTRCVKGFAMVLITNLLVVHSPPQVEIIKYFLLHPTRQTKSCNIERYNIKSHRHQFNNLILKSSQA